MGGINKRSGVRSDLLISVIVPVYNAAEFLSDCLGALLASDYERYEVLVVDDGSTDESAVLCRRAGVPLLRMEKQSGPAAARNRAAAEAKGDVLFFVDADVVVQPTTIARVARIFQEQPDTAAVFGSYDDAPHEPNFFSQYKNLYHHFVHQQSRPEATTFWTGCGAIRRPAFAAVGGFNVARYAQPSIEDIELGSRLRGAGLSILSDKELQVKHLKKWTLSSMLHADIFQRAIPWTQLLLENRQTINDLNLRTSDRVCAGLVGLSLLLVALSLFSSKLLYVTLLLLPSFLLTIGVLNHKLYRFFWQQRGFGFAAAAFPVQLLYYFYSGTAFVLCWCQHVLSGRSSRKV